MAPKYQFDGLGQRRNTLLLADELLTGLAVAGSYQWGSTTRIYDALVSINVPTDRARAVVEALDTT